MFSKMSEKFVHEQLLSHLLRCNIIDGLQFGFLPGRSTTDATFRLTQDIYMARNLSQISAIVFLDLKKAFDTVNHNILLGKLGKIGCNQNCVNWFRDYLTGRYQTTRANNKISGSREITCGVPQGSVLGPLLFIIYINDVVSNLKHSTYYLYADDLAIIVSGNSPDIISTLIQEDLDIISKWCYANVLTINAAKTNVLWCYPIRYLPNLNGCELYMNNIELKRVPEFNFIWV